MSKPGALAAADAIFDAELSLQRAMRIVDDLSDVAASSLRVLDDTAIDSFYAHQDSGRQFYLHSASESLVRLRTRSQTLSDLGADLADQLGETSRALERAGTELDAVADDRDLEVPLRTQIDVLGEVVALARPLAEQIGRHARHATLCAEQTDAQMLLDTRVHDAGRNMSRADEGVSMMRSVIETAQSRARTSAALAGSLSYGAALPPVVSSPRQEDQPAPGHRPAGTDPPSR